MTKLPAPRGKRGPYVPRGLTPRILGPFRYVRPWIIDGNGNQVARVVSILDEYHVERWAPAGLLVESWNMACLLAKTLHFLPSSAQGRELRRQAIDLAARLDRHDRPPLDCEV